MAKRLRWPDSKVAEKYSERRSLLSQDERHFIFDFGPVRLSLPAGGRPVGADGRKSLEDD